MKKHVYIFWVAFFSLALGACSKDKDNCDPNDEESPCYAGPSGEGKLLLIEEKKNGKTDLKFEYDDQNRVIMRYIYSYDAGVASILNDHFTYNNNGLLISVSHQKGSEVIYREEFTYDRNDKPISGVLVYPKDGPTGNMQYVYSGNKVIETITAKEGGSIINTYTFDDKGNPLVIEISGGNLVQTRQEFNNYDNKHYRYTNYPWGWKLRSVNNAQSYKMTAIGTGNVNVILDQTWEYTYNGAGYPTKIEVFDRQSKVLMETRTLSYKASE